MNATSHPDVRRTFETLAGWRLILVAFLLLCFLVLLTFLTFVRLPVSWANQDSFLLALQAILTAQLGSLTLGLGATSLPFTIRFSITAISTVWTLAILDSVWGLDVSKGQGGLSIIPMALLTFVVASCYGWNKSSFRFRIRDLLVLVAASAVCFSVGRNLASEWWAQIGLNSFEARINSVAILIQGSINAGLILVLLQIMFGGTIQIRQKWDSPVVFQLSIFLLIALFLIGIPTGNAVDYFSGVSRTASSFFVERICFMVTLSISLLPICGLRLAAKTRIDRDTESLVSI